MKHIYQATLQAMLDAACSAGADPYAGPDAVASSDGAQPGLTRTLGTKLGPLTLRTPLAASEDVVSDFEMRYLSNEAKVLSLMGRIFLRGRSTPSIMAEMAETLCGCRPDKAWIAVNAAWINAEMAACIERELAQVNHLRAHEPRPLWPRRGAPSTDVARTFLPDSWRCEA